MALTWNQALAWRLGRHLLDPVGTCSVGDVVGRLGAVPAHPDTTPELAVGLRRTSSRSGDVARALDAGEVFKTYAFRGAGDIAGPGAGTAEANRELGRGVGMGGRRRAADHVADRAGADRIQQVRTQPPR